MPVDPAATASGTPLGPTSPRGVPLDANGQPVYNIANPFGPMHQLKQGISNLLLAGGIHGNTLAQLGYTGGPLVPGASGLLQSAFDQAGNLGGSPEGQARSGLLTNLMGATPSFNPDPATRQAYIQSSIIDPATREFNDTVAPSIAARYGMGGNLGAAADVTAKAGAQLSSDLSGQIAGIYRGDEQMQSQSIDQARAQALQAAGQSYSDQTGSIGLLSQLGAAQRGITQQQNQEQLYAALQQQPWADPRLSLVGLLGNPTTYTPSVVGAPNTPGAGIGVLGSILGLAGGGGGAAAPAVA